MVEFLGLFLSKIVDDIRPTAFCLSDDNGVGMPDGFLWQDRRVNSAKNDLGTSLPE